MVPYTEWLAELSTLPREDAEYLGCIDEIEHAHEFVRRVTSAHLLLVAYQGALTDGADQRQTLEAVVDLPITETVIDL